MPLIFDIETNGILLPDVLHGGVVIDTVTGEPESYADRPGYRPIADFIRRLEAADKVIGHNAASFDVPQLRRLRRAQIRNQCVIDTIHATRVLWPDLRDVDREAGIVPPNLIGSHSLKAWGHHIGCLKGTFGETTDWVEWSPQMMDYCLQDTIVTWVLYVYILENDP